MATTDKPNLDAAKAAAKYSAELVGACFARLNAVSQSQPDRRQMPMKKALARLRQMLFR